MNPSSEQSPSAKKSLGSLPFLLAAILIGTIGLQIYNHVPLTKIVPMLPASADKIELTKFEDIASHTQTAVTLPDKLFGSSLYLIGIYPSAVKSWPANSVSLVFVKDNARFMEMEVLPNTKLETVSPIYTSYPQETVAITTNQNGLFVHLRGGYTCTNPRPNTVPTICLITNMLLFEHNGSLIQLSSDGNHISQGELLEVARSLP